MGRRQRFPRYTTRVLVWGGLRGGISVALALSLPRVLDGEPVLERDAILAMTYVVVVFSILVQGLTVGPLVKHWREKSARLDGPTDLSAQGNTGATSH